MKKKGKKRIKHCLSKNETIVKSIDTFHAAKNVRSLVNNKKKKKRKINQTKIVLKISKKKEKKKRREREGEKKPVLRQNRREQSVFFQRVALQRGRPMKRSRTQTPWKSDKRGAGMAFNGCLNEGCAGREMSRRYSIAVESGRN